MDGTDPTAAADEPVRDAPPPYRTVIFDCDSTLSTIEGIDELAGATHRDALAELTERAMTGEIALEEVYGLRLRRVRPSRAEVERVARRYVETLVDGMEALVRDLVRANKRVLVVSGGVLPAVRVLAEHLGLDPADAHAVDLVFDADGGYRDFDRASPLARSGGKPELISRLVRDQGLAPLALVGDGATDLEAAGVVDRFVAFGAVAKRAAVFARAAATAESVAALRPLLFAPDELAALDR